MVVVNNGTDLWFDQSVGYGLLHQCLFIITVLYMYTHCDTLYQSNNIEQQQQQQYAEDAASTTTRRRCECRHGIDDSVAYHPQSWWWWWLE